MARDPAVMGTAGPPSLSTILPLVTAPVASTVTVAQDQTGSFAVGLSESAAQYQVPSRSL